jgi:hypothetical protein
MSEMARRSGAADMVRLGVLAAAAATWAMAACGDSKSPPTTDPPGPETGAENGGSADAGDTEPPLVSSTPDAAIEGRPPITGLDPGVIPPPLQESCTPGETQSCLREQLCTGIATCAADGRGFGACECASTPAIGLAIVGAACTRDADCSDGATCMTANGNLWAGAGGPAGGYCTFPCEDSSECTVHDPQSGCIGVGPERAGYCLRSCLSKDAEPGEAKCLNRSNLACISEAATGNVGISAERQPGFCAPRCGSDDECPLGRVCHRQGGVCTPFPSPGAPVGSACMFEADCDGQACESRIDGVGVCTADCVLGSLAGCGYAATAELRKAGCITPLVAAGRFSEGPGDVGICRELCDVDSDCLQAANGFVCRPLTEALAAFTGRTGACARAN